MNKALKKLLVANYWQTFGFTLLSPLYAAFVINHLGGTEFQVGFTYSVYGLTAGFLIILFGKIEDKFRNKAKAILSAGYLLMSIASFSYLFVDSISELLLLQVFYAFAVAIYIPVNKTLYSLYEDDGKESTEWALLDGGNFLIIGLASLIGGYFVSEFGFEALFVLMGLSELVAAGAVMIIRDTSKVKESEV